MKEQQLKGEKIAVIGMTNGSNYCEQICEELKSQGADLTFVKVNGTKAPEWDGIQNVSAKDAEARSYRSLVVIADQKGCDELCESNDADTFVKGFFESKKPVSSFGRATDWLGELGLLDGRSVVVDDEAKEKAMRSGASVKPSSIYTDEGFTTAKSSTSTHEFAMKAAEEAHEGRHQGQHA